MDESQLLNAKATFVRTVEKRKSSGLLGGSMGKSAKKLIQELGINTEDLDEDNNSNSVKKFDGGSLERRGSRRGSDHSSERRRSIESFSSNRRGSDQSNNTSSSIHKSFRDLKITSSLNDDDEELDNNKIEMDIVGIAEEYKGMKPKRKGGKQSDDDAHLSSSLPMNVMNDFKGSRRESMEMSELIMSVKTKEGDGNNNEEGDILDRTFSKSAPIDYDHSPSGSEEEEEEEVEEENGNVADGDREEVEQDEIKGGDDAAEGNNRQFKRRMGGSRGTVPVEQPFAPQSVSPRTRRTARRQRHSGLLTSSYTMQKEQGTWRPLANSMMAQKPDDDDDIDDDEDYEEEEEERKDRNSATVNAAAPAAPTGFWGKLTASFTAPAAATKGGKIEGGGGSRRISIDSLSAWGTNPGSSASISRQISGGSVPGPNKEISPAVYFRKGKKKAKKSQYLQAVALFNFALVRQREELGEDHIDCGTTLNEIGVCWMMLGERYPAITAFEEALFIRQKHCGDGAMEVAEVTNNIWMILHEERCEMEKMMQEMDESRETDENE